MKHDTWYPITTCQMSRVTLSEVNQTLRINKHCAIIDWQNSIPNLDQNFSQFIYFSKVYLNYNGNVETLLKQIQLLLSRYKRNDLISTRMYFSLDTLRNLILYNFNFGLNTALAPLHWLDIWKLPWRKRSLNMVLAYLFHFLRSPRV